MPKKPIVVEKWEYHPLTPDRWDDFEQLFGPNGACFGCWCAWFLMTNKEFTTSKKEGHKELMRTLVQSGVEPGIIAYADGKPAGWVALLQSSQVSDIGIFVGNFIQKVDSEKTSLFMPQPNICI